MIAELAALVPRGTWGRLELYHALLLKWQKAINLVGPTTLADAWRRHFLDSAQLWPLVQSRLTQGPTVLADLGTGAGFPGLVLAIAAEDQPLAVHLVESDSRKCAFLIEVAQATKTKVQIHAVRAETLKLHADIVTARALAPLDKLLGLAAPLLKPDGECLFLKGAEAASELTQAGQSWKMHATLQPSLTDPAARLIRITDLSSK